MLKLPFELVRYFPVTSDGYYLCPF